MRFLLGNRGLCNFYSLVLVTGTIPCLLNFYNGFILTVPERQHQKDHKSDWRTKNIDQQRNVIPKTKSSNPPPHPRANQVIPLNNRQPTHQACNGYEGIYHIAMTDILGGVGTALIQLVLGQLSYADSNHLKPWVFLNNQSQVFYDPLIHGAGPGVSLTALVGRNASYVAPSRQSYRNRRDFIPGPLNSSWPLTKQTLHFEGTGVWEHYFEPVSDFVPGDRSCESKLYVTMDLYLITPGIHGFSKTYATRSWRYDYLPDYITQPHVPLHEWLLPQRQKANRILSKYIRFKPHLHKWANEVNPHCHMQSNPCLGLHIRHSDKAAGRRQIAVAKFLPFAWAFVQQGGTQIYLATDSHVVVSDIVQTWPDDVRSRVRTLGPQVIRSNNTNAVFDMASHHRTNQEALVEILALSQCQFLVHGLSAVSESSIWIAMDLHYRSVNLEDEDHLNETAFATLVQQSLEGSTTKTLEELPRPPQTNKWWNRLLLELPEYDPTTTTANNGGSGAGSSHGIGACDGFNGILYIAHVAIDSAPGQAFFESVLNQFILAMRLKLVPYVHLSCTDSKVLMDNSLIPQLQQNSTFQASAFLELVFDQYQDWQLPKVIAADVSSSTTSFHVTGCNIWDLYFESVPKPYGESCTSKPIFVLNQKQVSGDLGARTSGLVHAWRRDELIDSVWKNPEQQPVDWKASMWPARVKGHDMITKHYRVRDSILQQVDLVNPIRQGDVCMAVHIRASGKTGRYRKTVTAEKYIPYMKSFVRAGGNVIYIGTDSSRALRYLVNSLPPSIHAVIRTQGKYVVRSNSKIIPPHALDSHHRVNSETLVDMYAMSKCHFLLHSYSIVPEVAIYLNLQLHNNSVNLEVPHPMNLESFEETVTALVKRHAPPK